MQYENVVVARDALKTGRRRMAAANKILSASSRPIDLSRHRGMTVLAESLRGGGKGKPLKNSLRWEEERDVVKIVHILSSVYKKYIKNILTPTTGSLTDRLFGFCVVSIKLAIILYCIFYSRFSIFFFIVCEVFLSPKLTDRNRISSFVD